VSAARMAVKIGRTLPCIIDGWDAEESVHIGRSQADAPDVDGIVRITGEAELAPGDIVPVTITGADAYDLEGRVNAPPPGAGGR
ncbi:MAG: 30S ribosomal protein S12 methylthiotransferase RimO, partial [Pseudomonadota bacterium]